MFGSCKKLDRAALLDRMGLLMPGAMAFFGKNRCLVVVDRDGQGYEVGFGHMTSSPTLAERQAGDRLFGHLQIVDRPLNFAGALDV